MRRVLIGLILLILFLLLVWFIWTLINPPEVNQPPTAENLTITVMVNESFTGSLPITDPEQEAITPSIVTMPTNGMVNLFDGLMFTYTPNNNYSGPDSFVFQGCDPQNNCVNGNATINVMAAPTAVDDELTTALNTPAEINVLANDTPTGALAAIPINETRAEGTISLAADGRLTYSPAQDYSGAWQLSYQACLTAMPGTCNDGLVSITVTAGQPQPPTAVDDTFTFEVGMAYTGNVITGSDSDPNGLPLTLNATPAANPTQGTVTLAPDGTFTYTPTNDVTTTLNDTFGYEVCNSANLCAQATVSLTITPPATVSTHEIQQGEWLHQIARCYGTTVSAVVDANEIKNPNKIFYPGKTLNIPNPGSQGPVTGPPCIDVHIVVAGDTLYSIAEDNGIRLIEVARINRIWPWHKLSVGQRIVLPRPIPDYMQR